MLPEEDADEAALQFEPKAPELQWELESFGKGRKYPSEVLIPNLC